MRYLPVLLWIALLVYCSIDLAQSDAAHVRRLPRPVWLLIVLVVPFLGPLAWLLAGRPARPGGRVRFSSARGRPSAPDDDPEFLAAIARSNQQRERERRHREQTDRPPDEPGPSA